MSKNMTRKGLTLGTSLALVASGLTASLPAQASELLTLAPTSGTSYNTLATSTFNLAVGFDSSIGSASYAYLKYAVTNASEVDIRAEMDNATAEGIEKLIQSGTASTAATRTALTITDWAVANAGGASSADRVTFTVASSKGLKVGDYVTIASFNGTDDGTATTETDKIKTAVNGNTFAVAAVASGSVSVDVASTTVTASTTAANATATAGTITFESLTSDDSFVVGPEAFSSKNQGTIGVSNTLSLSTTKWDADTALVVRAFLDLNNNNTVDAGETTSPARTVTFKKVSGLTGTIAMDTPLIGASQTLVAVVTLSGDLNYQQITSGDVVVEFTDVTNTGSEGTISAAWDTTDGRFEATSNSITIASGEQYKAELKLANGDDALVNDVEAELTVTVVTATTDIITIAAAEIAGSVDNTQTAEKENSTSPDNADYANSQAGTAKVKTTTASFNVGIFIGDNSAVEKPVATTAVVTATAGAGVTSGELKVGGKAVVNGTPASITLVTGADGKATLLVEGAGVDTTETLTLAVKAEGVTSTNYVITFEDASYTIVNLSDLGAANQTIAVGGTLSINYAAVDQWGKGPGTDHLIYVERVVSTARGTTAAAWAHAVDLNANGRATVNITDNGVGTGADTVRASLRKKIGTSFGSAIDVTNGSDQLDFTLTYVAAADVAVGSVTVAVANDGSSTAEPLEKVAVFANHHALVDTTVAAPAPGSTNSDDDVTVTVKKANGTALAGVPVTISAPGLLIKEATSGSSNVFAVGSITAITNGSGQVVVTVYGQKAGKQTVTATSGGKSASKDITYAAAAAGDGATLTLNAPASAGAGTTFRIGGTLTDKYGNPVEISSAGSGGNPTLKVTWDGPGFVSGSLPTTTSATGEFFFYVLLGTNDSGSGKVVVSYDADGTTTTKSAISSTATVALGKTAVGAGKVNVGSFNGKLVVYASGLNGARISWKVGGNWGSQVASSNYAIFNRPTPRAGVTVSVDIYVNGVKTLTKSVVTR